MKLLFACILFLSSLSAFADTYPTVPTTTYTYNTHVYNSVTDLQNAVIALKGWGSLISSGNYHTTQAFVSGYQYIYLYRNSDNYLMDSGGAAPVVSQTCPSGGTVSGTSCINAPACTSTQFRNSTTELCQNLAVCTPPEHDNGFGICGVSECTVSQVLNPSTGVCQTPPFCGSTQAYDSPSNTCFNKTLDCPGHSHASTANDKCLADAPLACSSGQHDDGTYTCVADNAVGCSADQTRGFINGSLQCIKKPNSEMFAKQAADAAANAAVKSSAEIAANAANRTAQQNLAANPTDPATIAAANTAGNNMFQAAQDSLGASRAASAAKDTAQSTDQLASTQSLDSINKSLAAMSTGTGKAFTLQTAGVFSDATVNTAVDNAKSDFNTQFQSISSQVQSLFTFSHSGTGTLPVFDFGTIFHVHVVANLNNYAAPLSYVGLTVMFLAAYISVRIFLE